MGIKQDLKTGDIIGKLKDFYYKTMWSDKFGRKRALSLAKADKDFPKVPIKDQAKSLNDIQISEQNRLGIDPKDNLGYLPRFQKHYGRIATAGIGAYEGLGIAKELNSLIQNQNNTNDYVNNIKDLAYMNPLGTGQLDPRSQKLLRQIQNGTWKGNSFSGKLGGAMEGGLTSLPKAILKGLGSGFLTGNPYAGLISGVGTAIRGGLKGANTGQYDAELQGLYDQLNQAEADYRGMRRPSNVYQSGLRTQARTSLY